MNQIRFSKMLCVLFLFVLVACQAQSITVPSSASSTLTPTSVPIPSASPTDVPSLMSDPQALATLTGNYTFKAVQTTYNLFLYSDGSYSSVSGFGSFTAIADQITFVENSIECASQPGVYKWSLENNVLQFTLVEDACKHRAYVFSSYTFERSQDPSALAPKVIGQWKINNPSFIASGFGSLWVTDHYNHNITRIDPVSNQVIAVIQGTGTGPEQALEVGDLLWVTGQSNDTTLIDPKTNTVIKTLKGSLLYLAYGFNSVWITTRDNKLDRFDPVTAEIIASIPVGDGNCDCMNDVLVTAGGVWVISCDKTELIKVDPVTNSVVSKTTYAALIDEAKAQTTVPVGKGTDFIWIDVLGDEGKSLPSGLLRIDSITGSGLTFLPLSPEQAGDGFISVSDEAVWLAGHGEINRVNIATNQIDATFITDPGRLKVGVAFGSVWLRNFEQSLIQRLDVEP